MQKIELICVNNGCRIGAEAGISLAELLEKLEFEQPYPILVARVNNRYKGPGTRLYKPSTVEFFDVRHYEGYRVYQRTLSFVLQRAMKELFPERRVLIRHTLGSGFYCEFEGGEELSLKDYVVLKSRMMDIVQAALPITHGKMLTSELLLRYAYNEGAVEHAAVTDPTIEQAVELLLNDEEYRRILREQNLEMH